MNRAKFIHRSSKIFQPMIAIPKNNDSCKVSSEIASKSQKLLLNTGYIRPSLSGYYHILPLGHRVLNKLINLIDRELRQVNAQKVRFPTLSKAKLWQSSGRYDEVIGELFKLKDRHSTEFILSPTHEESVAELIASLGTAGMNSYKDYPLKLYQVSTKFRDEMKTRYGLMRAREFIMKDLYTFDIGMQQAQSTYEEMCACYDSIFQQIGVDFVKVLSSSGSMGGNLSHEYHFVADIGEDKLLHCNDCKFNVNVEYLNLSTVAEQSNCSNCGSANTQFSNGIEVGHTFLLGDVYSKKLGAKYLAADGKPQVLQMGSYGLGITRIIAACVEVLSDELTIKWPYSIAPFKVVVIGPKSGSKEEEHVGSLAEETSYKLNEISYLHDDVLLDDRSTMTIGKRLLEAKRAGYPFAVIIGKKSCESQPLFEVDDLYTSEQQFFSFDQLLHYFSQKEEFPST